MQHQKKKKRGELDKSHIRNVRQQLETEQLLLRLLNTPVAHYLVVVAVSVALASALCNMGASVLQCQNKWHQQHRMRATGVIGGLGHMRLKLPVVVIMLLPLRCCKLDSRYFIAHVRPSVWSGVMSLQTLREIFEIMEFNFSFFA